MLFKRSNRYLLAMMLVLIQAVLPAVAQHQLHAGNRYEESLQHQHITFTQPVMAVDDCALHDCDPEHSSAEQHHYPHQDQQLVDLCLDCPCHGSHLSLPQLNLPQLPVGATPLVTAAELHYVTQALEPAYRPPITAVV
ncbi:hypothetical protein HR45_08360 [Shewanella mangrovi]|uniref:Rieske domain-containing protein n=1 Tax=Shewanella mangrovi TaxID=1515746 RepID=A0A094JIK8_9GAMM|nr:hypothetical protein [Shewanella mangrovi]KFZ37854.1 hypothetical protein HR45_08360 [Shewanella mangrovi]